jgi:hypothetical protein
VARRPDPLSHAGVDGGLGRVVATRPALAGIVFRHPKLVADDRSPEVLRRRGVHHRGVTRTGNELVPNVEAVLVLLVGVDDLPAALGAPVVVAGRLGLGPDGRSSRTMQARTGYPPTPARRPSHLPTLFASPSMSGRGAPRGSAGGTARVVLSSTTIPNGGRAPSANGVFPVVPVARTSHSMLPSW